MKQEDRELLLKDLCASINSERWLSLDDYPDELWKPIEGFDDRYMVSNIGRVKTKEFTYTLYGKLQVRLAHILRTIIRKDGYCKVSLGGHGKQKTLNLHRLVATAFVPNPNNYPIINHKDENPTNNFVFVNPDGTIDIEKSNLEWCTYKYNNNYGSFKEKHSIAFKNYPKFSKPVVQMTLEGEDIQEFPSIAEAARQLSGNYVNIADYLREPNKRNHAYGYKWRFKETVA